MERSVCFGDLRKRWEKCHVRPSAIIFKVGHASPTCGTPAYIQQRHEARVLCDGLCFPGVGCVPRTSAHLTLVGPPFQKFLAAPLTLVHSAPSEKWSGEFFRASCIVRIPQAFRVRIGEGLKVDDEDLKQDLFWLVRVNYFDFPPTQALPWPIIPRLITPTKRLNNL